MANQTNSFISASRASGVGYTPSIPADWLPPPNNVQDALDELAAGNSPSSTLITRPYVPGVVLRDAVYQCPDGRVDRASAASVGTSPAIGFVATIDVPSAGLCQIQQAGDLAGFVGLVVSDIYILSKAAGQILTEDDEANPDFPERDQPGTVVQSVGVAASPTVINIRLEEEIIN